jgi:phage tail sheath protein FI
MFNNSTTSPESTVYIADISNGTHSIEGVNTSIAAFIGLAKKGPTNKPIKIISSVGFKKIFGSIHKEYHLGCCVQHFFLNGGTLCYVIRVRSQHGRQYISDKSILGKAGGKSGGTGIHSLDSIDYFNILCIPPYNNKKSVSNTVYRNALKYCESKRAFLIIDPPFDWIKNNTRKIPNDDELEKKVGNLRHPNGALYYPHIRIQDPLDDDNMRTFVPSGAIAGIIARTDNTFGVWKAPAGSSAHMTGVSELELTLTDDQIGQLNERGVNCLRAIPPSGIVICGSRTLVKKESNSEPLRFWKYLPVRRLALYIEESLYRGTKWVVFEPNDEPLWSKIRVSVSCFMNGLFESGAFQGTKPSEAYFIKCDRETTTQVDIDNGIVNILVGFAPLKPAEFVIIKIQQTAEHGSNRIRKKYHGRKNRK